MSSSSTSQRTSIPLNILSEEAGYIDNQAEKTLVIDPIDGTYNSVMGIPFYSVSMAIGTKSMADVEAGLVQNVVTGERFYAETGKGAFQDGCRMKVRKYRAEAIDLLRLHGQALQDGLLRRDQEGQPFPLHGMRVAGDVHGGQGQRGRVLF